MGLLGALNRERRFPDAEVAEFMAHFSRFEYALKRAGFAREYGNGVQANWEGFRSACEAGPHDVVLAAGAFLFESPPRKQILRNGRVEWGGSERPDGFSDLEWVLILVRRVRNNLFHRGKLQDPPIGLSRDLDLLAASQRVLWECLKLETATEVRKQFEDDLPVLIR